MQPNGSLTVINFGAEHVAEIAAIEAASYRDPWSQQSFVEVLALAETSWVALREGRVVAYLITQWVLDEVHVLNVAVAPEFRRQGIASRLLNDLLESAAQRQIRNIFLEVRKSNAAAQEAYRKCGFMALAARRSYYPDGEDAVVMYLPLANEATSAGAVFEANTGTRYGH